MTGGFEAAWTAVHPAVRRSLELAYESLAAGGLAVGSVLTDADDRILAEGRNRAYDPPGGPDALQGTPLAHAEMNVLAAVRTGWELAACTLWSTQEPCSMCAAAAAFTGVGRVRYVAPDPWAVATEQAASAADGPAGDLWVVTANVLFLHAVASSSGVDHPTVTRNRELEPETAAIVVDLVAEGLTAEAWTRGRSAGAALSGVWDRIVAAAAARARRAGPQS
jgi:tRNA(Arg) A34 adenosine deaminase TadA